MQGKNRRRKQSAANSHEAGPQGAALAPSKKAEFMCNKCAF